MILNLKTLSPLHIGNGEELHVLDYIVYQNKFYRLPSQLFFRFLAQFGLNEANRFADWTIKISDKIDDLEQKKKNSPRGGGMDFGQELSKLRKSFNYLSFAREIGKEKEFLQFITTEVPGIPIGNPLQLRPQIRGLMKTGDNKAYIPGSSVKGSIRTALLYNILNKELAKAEVEKVINEALSSLKKEKSVAREKNKRLNTEKLKKSFADGLEHLAFYCPFIDQRGKTRINDEKSDVLKFLIISDGMPKSVSTRVDNIDIFLVKKLPKGKMEAQCQTQAPGIEAISQDTSFEITLNFDIDTLLGIQKSLKNGTVKTKDGQSWGSLAQKIKQVYGIDITKANESNKEKLRQDAINHILNCVRTFSRAQLEHDVKWTKQFVDNDLSRAFTLPLVDGYRPIMEKSGGTLLHLGYATGFTSTTAVLFMITHFKSLLKSIMEEFGIGDSPTAFKTRKPGERYAAQPDNFPKSRRWIHRPDLILPPGWIEVVNGPVPPDAQPIIFAIQGSAQPEKSKEPAVAVYPKGKIRQNSELDAEIISSGIPNRIKLYINESSHPIIDLKYGVGFGEDKVGRIIVVSVAGVNGKGEVLSVRFIKVK